MGGGGWWYREGLLGQWVGGPTAESPRALSRDNYNYSGLINPFRTHTPGYMSALPVKTKAWVNVILSWEILSYCSGTNFKKSIVGPKICKIHEYLLIGRIELRPVLRIHGILVWIRIRNRGSIWPSRCEQKTIFCKQFFYLLLFDGTFTSFFKDKGSKRVTK